MAYKITFLSLLLFSLAIATLAQEGVTASGGDISGTAGSVSYSVGQVFFQSNSGSTGNLIEGVQQPYELVTVNIFEPIKNEIVISIFPNPTLGRLNIGLNELIGNKLEYRIIDFQGQVWDENKLNSTRTRIELHQLPPAPYLLQIWQDNQLIQSSKIIKN